MFIAINKAFSITKSGSNHKKFIDKIDKIPVEKLARALQNPIFKKLWKSLDYYLEAFHSIDLYTKNKKELEAANVFIKEFMDSKIKLYYYGHDDHFFKEYEPSTDQGRMKIKIITEFEIKQYFNSNMALLNIDEFDQKLHVTVTLESILLRLLNYPNTNNIDLINIKNPIYILPYYKLKIGHFAEFTWAIQAYGYTLNLEYFLKMLKSIGIKEDGPLKSRMEEDILSEGYLDAYFNAISMTFDKSELDNVEFLTELLNIDEYFIRCLKKNMNDLDHLKSPLQWIKIMVKSHFIIDNDIRHKLFWKY